MMRWMRIYTRRGAYWIKRFPRIVAAVQKLKVRSVLLDGEGINCQSDGPTNIELLRSKENADRVALCAFDLLKHDGDDVRPQPRSVKPDRASRICYEQANEPKKSF